MCTLEQVMSGLKLLQFNADEVLSSLGESQLIDMKNILSLNDGNAEDKGKNFFELNDFHRVFYSPLVRTKRTFEIIVPKELQRFVEFV